MACFVVRPTLFASPRNFLRSPHSVRTMSASTHTTITLPSGKPAKVPTSLFSDSTSSPALLASHAPQLTALAPCLDLLVDNEWRPSSTGETFESFDPSTGKKVLDFAHASAQDVDDAVKAARRAFRTTWGKNIAGADRAISTSGDICVAAVCCLLKKQVLIAEPPSPTSPPPLRAVIHRFADLIERDAAYLASLESFDSGKGVKIALDSDVGDTVACLRFFAGLADKIHGQTIDCFAGEKMVYTLHEPIGVCGQIIPWNYPLLMWAWKVAPALSAGCCVVMKPSELSSLTALALCELAVEAGIPPGVVNTVTGLGVTTGNAIARYARTPATPGAAVQLADKRDHACHVLCAAIWTSTRSPSLEASSPAGASQLPLPTRT